MLIIHDIPPNKLDNMCNTSGYKNNKKSLRFRADQYDVRHWQSKLSSFFNIYQQLFYNSDRKPIVHYFYVSWSISEGFGQIEIECSEY